MKEFMDFDTDDVRAYWCDTFVGVKKDDHFEAYYVNDAEWSGKEKDSILHVSRGDVITDVLLNDPNLISYVPELGMKQIGIKACYFTKAARRQWKKGLRGGQYNSRYINYVNERHNRCNMHHINLVDRDNMFNPTHCDLSDALEMLLEGYTSVALSPNFAVTKHPRSFDPLLCHRGDLVGKVTKGELYLLEEYSELTGTLTDEVGECHAM